MRTLTTVLIGVALFLAPGLASDADHAFLAENAAVMDRMMKDMSVAPSGDVDSDFVNMMEPHHQGAIDMAVLELRYGKNEKLRRIAQEIIIDQRQEIDAMRLAVGRKLLPSTPAPTTYGPATGNAASH